MIVEIKAIKQLTPVEDAQLLNFGVPNYYDIRMIVGYSYRNLGFLIRNSNPQIKNQLTF